MKAEMQKRLDAECLRHADAIDALANERVQEFAKEWRRKSRKSIELLFGMGTMYVELEGTQISEWQEGYPESLKRMEADVDEITDGLRRGCPNDLKIGPLYEK